MLLAAKARATTPPTEAQLAAEGAYALVLTNDTLATSTPPRPVNPNILILLVDQLRLPQFWTNATQQAQIDSIAPNIAFLRKNSCNFQYFHTAAATCTPARSVLFTGLYTPQTGMYLGVDGGAPSLDPRFPTFGYAVADQNPAYKNNVFLEGKWHLSDGNGSGSLAPYGFNIQGTSGSFYPDYPDHYGSPNGTGNEGSSGFSTTTNSPWGSDSAIAGDFVAKWPRSPASPWLSVVSLINPHDISFYPALFPPAEPTRPAGSPISGGDDFYPSFSGVPTADQVYTTASPIGPDWNWNDPVSAKNISLQVDFQDTIGTEENAPGNAMNTQADGVAMLNYYFYLVSLVDAQIGNVLNAVGLTSRTSGNTLSNTVVIFTSDHGEFGFSHGLRGKGGAAYDEAIRIPLYVMLPGQVGTIPMAQMCSQVDFFRFIVDLAVGSANPNWMTGLYSDQANRQSLVNFIWGGISNNAETRTVRISASGSGGPSYVTPYILHTTDEIYVFEEGTTIYGCNVPNHLTCFRLKTTDSNDNNTGAKLCTYDQWTDGTTTVIAADRQYEFYDYANLGNRLELGNDYTSTNTATQDLIAAMTGALASSQIQNELRGTLSGVYPAASPYPNVTLSSVTASATSAYESWAQTLADTHDGCPGGTDG